MPFFECGHSGKLPDTAVKLAPVCSFTGNTSSDDRGFNVRNELVALGIDPDLVTAQDFRVYVTSIRVRNGGGGASYYASTTFTPYIFSYTRGTLWLSGLGKSTGSEGALGTAYDLTVFVKLP